MRYVSLFSGIEAASVAWGPLGWEPVAFSEIERFPCEVLAARFPEVPNLGDVSKIDWSGYAGAVDLVVGGSPCQAFSVAGRRRGLVDSRGQLMLEYVRAVRETRPRWVVWENVPGVLSQDKGRAFGTLLGELEDCGYSLAWRVLDAQFFGVAQRRRRVFVVGHLGEGAHPAAVLFERESLRWDSSSSKAKRQELARSAGSGPRGGGGAGPAWSIAGNVCDREARQNGSGVSEEVAPTLSTADRHAVACGERDCLNPWDVQSKRVFAPDSCAPTLSSGEGEGMNIAPSVLTAGDCLNPWPPQHDRVFAPGSVYQTLCAHGSGGADRGAVLGSFGFAQNSRDEVRVVGDGTVSGALAAEPGAKQTTYVCQPCVAFSAGQSSESGSVGAQEEVAPTLRAGSSGTNQVPTVCMSDLSANAAVDDDLCGTVKVGGAPPAVLTARGVPFGLAWRWPWTVRRLMPVECERLQGFPDGWTDLGGTPDTPRYKALGNSMAVPVMEWIGRRIAMVDAIA